MIKIASILILCFVTIFSSVEGAENHFKEEIEKIPFEISDVWTGGTWEYNNGFGYYRVIYVGFHYGCSLLYIQWLRDWAAPGVEDRRVVYTLSIDEFNRDDHISITFKKPKCKELKRGLLFDIDARNGNEENKRHRYRLKIFSEFGKYELTER